MNSKFKYGFEMPGIQSALETMSPVFQSIQMSDAINSAIHADMATQQLFNAAQPMREAMERWDRIANSVDMVGLREVLGRTAEISKTFSMMGINDNLQSALKSVSLQANLGSAVNQLNFGMAPFVMKQIQGISIDISAIESAVRSNLEIFKGMDWSSIVSPEDLEELDLENTLEGPVIDINDGISLQQKIVDFVNKIKTKYPIMFFIFLYFIFPPIQDGVIGGVTQLIKGTTAPITEQTQITDYKAVEKNIKIEVNNTFNINIESKDIRDKLLKIYGYVSTDELVIRKSNRINSRALYTLEFGQVVRIIHKDRNWTLVEYESDEDTIRGWVFTRYVSRFRK